MMKILSLDTSTKILTIAITEDKKTLFEYARSCEKEHTKYLFLMLQDLLKKTGLSIGEIDVFAVGIGPGSFTGTRIALTVMKGLAYTQEKPIVGISTLEVIASNLSEYEGEICPILDAKRGNAYAAIYKKSHNRIERITEYLLIPFAQILEKVGEDVFFLGDAIIPYRREILKKLPKANFAPSYLWYPKASNLGIMAYERFSKGEIDSLFDLAPLYLYPKECSVTLKK